MASAASFKRPLHIVLQGGTIHDVPRGLSGRTRSRTRRGPPWSRCPSHRAFSTVMAPSLSATLFAILIFVFGISTARAMPLAPLQAGLLIPVASGCGLGVHRGPLDGCYPVYGYYAGYGGGYRNNYYTGFNSGGEYSGRGTHSQTILMEYAGWQKTDH